ncbi:MAG TPA: FtsX-like permease family protein, partial [Blastocatellia bacterium]|nr:FtsX-like permease family protein [Blastocatellia bacterium]
SRYWPGENPIGKRLRFAVGSPWITVAGVVASGRTESLEAPNVPLIYQSLYQRRAKDLALFLRGKLNAAAIPAQVRQAVQSVDPELPVFKAQTFDDILSASLAERRFSMEMIGLFALTALLLAGMGIYGVISYVVGERKHEIGIRLALGAQSRDVMRMVLRQGLRLALTGCALGLICAVIVSHLMAGLLYGVSPTDPAAFAGVVLVLVGVALLACYVPARRAMKLDATVALRHD